MCVASFGKTEHTQEIPSLVLLVYKYKVAV